MHLVRNVASDLKIVYTASLHDGGAADLSFTSTECTEEVLFEFHLGELVVSPFAEHMSQLHPTATRLFEKSTGGIYLFHGKSAIVSASAGNVGIQYDSETHRSFVHYRLPCRETLACIATNARQYKTVGISLDVGWSEKDFRKVSSNTRLNLDVSGISITFN